MSGSRAASPAEFVQADAIGAVAENGASVVGVPTRRGAAFDTLGVDAERLFERNRPRAERALPMTPSFSPPFWSDLHANAGARHWHGASRRADLVRTIIDGSGRALRFVTAPPRYGDRSQLGIRHPPPMPRHEIPIGSSPERAPQSRTRCDRRTGRARSKLA